MVNRKKVCVALGLDAVLPDNVGHQVFFPKNLITHFSEIAQFMIINRNEYNPIFTQEVASEIQSGIHHVQPFGVITTFG